MKFLKRHRKQIVLAAAILLVLLTIFLRIYNLDKRFSFEWDQQRDADVMQRLLIQHDPVLIGPVQASEQYGFFLGPWYFYILAIFYAAFGLHPIASGAFSVFCSLLIAIGVSAFVYFVVKKSPWKNQADIAGLLSLAIFSADWRVKYAFNAGLAPIAATAVLAVIWLTPAKWQQFKLPLSALLTAFAINFHFGGVFLLLPVAWLAWQERKAKYFVRTLLISLVLFAVPFVPILLFDLTHNWLDSKLFWNFFFSPHETTTVSGFDWRRPIGGVLSMFDFVFLPFGYWISFAQGIFLISLVVGFWKMLTRPQQWLMGVYLVPPLVLFMFYSQFQAYYLYSLIPGFVLLFVLGAVYFWTKFQVVQWLIPIIVIWFVVVSAFAVKGKIFENSLYYKQQAVQYIINQKQDPIFNVSYQTWPGHNSGFDYLFTYYGKRPEDSERGHLYTITVPAGYQETTPSATFGQIGVTRR